MPKLIKPSLKMKQVAKRYIELNGNKKQAVLDVYDVKETSASALADSVFNNPMVQQEIKQLLINSGIDLDFLNVKTKKAIEDNLTNGKPSQAVGADLVKFMYKLHNVIPANKNMNLSYSKKVIENKTTEELTEELKKLNENYIKLSKVS